MIINNLLAWTIASEAFLLLSFIIIYLTSTSRSPKKNVLLVIFFFIGGGPLLYLSIDHMINNYIDANIGLGFAFMFTWIYSIIAFFVASTLLFAKRRNKGNKFT